jgi:DNA replication protein DnaC
MTPVGGIDFFATLLEGAHKARRMDDAQYTEVLEFSRMTLAEQTRVVVDEHNASPGLLDGEHCPKCLDRGSVWFVDPDDNGTIREQPCGCARGRSTFREPKQHRDSPNFRQTFANFSTQEPWQREMAELAKDYSRDHRHNWLLLMGQPGSGKTHLGYAVLNDALRQGMTTSVMHWRDDMDRYKANMLDDEAQADMERFRTVDMLMVDDLYRDDPNDKDYKNTFSLLDYRYSRMLPTVITYQYGLGRLLKTGDGIEAEALVSRIIERYNSESTGRKWSYRVEDDTRRNWRMRGI